MLGVVEACDPFAHDTMRVCDGFEPIVFFEIVLTNQSQLDGENSILQGCG